MNIVKKRMYANIYMHIWMNVQLYRYKNIYMYMHIFIFVFRYAYTCVYIYICQCICISLYIYLQIWIHKYRILNLHIERKLFQCAGNFCGKICSMTTCFNLLTWLARGTAWRKTRYFSWQMTPKTRSNKKSNQNRTTGKVKSANQFIRIHPSLEVVSIFNKRSLHSKNQNRSRTRNVASLNWFS